MAIIRTGNGSCMLHVAEDDRLSWSARGLLLYLLSKPDSWQVSVQQLQNVTARSSKKTGRDGIYIIISELIEAGYVTRVHNRDCYGRMAEHDYVVTEYSRTVFGSGGAL